MYTRGIVFLIVDVFLIGIVFLIVERKKEALSDAIKGSRDNIIFVPVCITITSIVSAVFIKLFLH